MKKFIYLSGITPWFILALSLTLTFAIWEISCEQKLEQVCDNFKMAALAHKQFAAGIHFDKQRLIAISGILCSFVLFSFIQWLTRSCNLVQKQVVETTHNLVESEARARLILDTAVNAIITMGADRRISTFNPAAETMFGYTAKEVLGQNVNMLMPEPFHSLHDAYVTHHLNTGEHKIIGVGREVTGRRHDGSTFPLWLAINSALLDDDVLFVGCIVDISKRKAAENVLVAAKEAAEAANRAKSAFLANMSHELRTPLNAVLGYAQILQNDQSLSETQRQGVNTIRRSGNHLLTLINDVLDLAKVEAGHLELFPHTFSLGHFFAEIQDLFRIRATEKGLTFYYQAGDHLPTKIHADEKRLRQVCLNLLGNAMKFTERGEVRLEANYKDNELTISVIDTGMGISEAMRGQIFQPFVQTGADKYKQQGTGLGLAISRSLVERMGGRIELETEAGIGSCFRLHIPVTVISMTPAIPEATANHAAMIIGLRRTDTIKGPFRVLVVDDIAANRAVLHGLLEPLGFNITEAVDGAEAVAVTEGQNFDLILMDLVMPKMDGLTATRHILSRSDNANRFIIALTASAFEEDRATSQAIGCRDYIVKPIDRSVLLQSLHKHLPLEWEYAKPPQVSSITTTQEATLSNEQHQTLINMVQRGAILDIISYLEQLSITPNCPDQAQSLLALARKFKLADIRHILDASVLR